MGPERFNFWYRVVPSDRQWSLGEDYYFADDSKVEDIWAVSQCKRISDERPRPYKILAGGPVVDFNPTTHGGIVVSRRLGDLLRSLLPSDRVQFLPAAVSGARGEWEAVNVLDCVECLDYSRSRVLFFDDTHPDKPGKPRSVAPLIINPNRAAGHDMFRVRDWEVAVLVSQRMKEVWEAAQITGVDFWAVT